MSQERSAFSDAASRAVLDAAPEGILVVNREGQIVRVNTQTEELFGYGPDGLLDLQFEVLVPELFREEYERQIAGYTRAPGLRPGRVGLELRGRRKDGTEVLLEMSLCWWTFRTDRWCAAFFEKSLVPGTPRSRSGKWRSASVRWWKTATTFSPFGMLTPVFATSAIPFKGLWVTGRRK